MSILPIIHAIKYLEEQHLDVTVEKQRALKGVASEWCDGLMDDLEYKRLVKALTGHVPSAKSWDSRDPLRKSKTQIEDLLSAIFADRLSEQLRKIKEHSQLLLPDIEDDDYLVKIANTLYMGAGYGIGGVVTKLTFDIGKPNQFALDWAKNYTYDLIKGIDDTTRSLLQDAISGFTEGGDLQSIIDQLSPYFGERRAQLIATTETTRAFAEGQKLAADEIAKEFPNAKELKQWFNAEDDRVCEDCAANSDAGKIPVDEPYPSGDDHVPAHPGDRCWEEYYFE